ncbi:MAG: hypothetical protein ACREU2_04395 [Steroidobacteraceae bacterium]
MANITDCPHAAVLGEHNAAIFAKTVFSGMSGMEVHHVRSKRGVKGKDQKRRGLGLGLDFDTRVVRVGEGVDPVNDSPTASEIVERIIA